LQEREDSSVKGKRAMERVIDVKVVQGMFESAHFDVYEEDYGICDCDELVDIYATRIGLMKAIRKGAAWVIHVDDIREYERGYLKKSSNVSQGVS